MRLPRTCYQMQQTIAYHFPQLRPAQQRGLALWVYGAILAQSACQNAVVTALTTLGRWEAQRKGLREWLYDGRHRSSPCATQVEVSRCFAPLLGWVLAWWQDPQLALAIDATLQKQRLCALVISVLYRGNAIPVAWHILPANQKGAWLPPILELLDRLHPAVPASTQVLVLTDRGLWSPRLWKGIRALGWHPLMRVQRHTSFQPLGGTRQPAAQLIPGPGHAWVGWGTAFRQGPLRRFGTLLVVWDQNQEEPWLVLTDLPPQDVGVCWYGLRVWIELGFRALKGVGWRWEHSQRTDPQRVARHWLVLAVAMLWVLACGTRVEDALAQRLPPGRLRSPVVPQNPWGRRVSVFRQGIIWLSGQLWQGRLWRRFWLAPEPWPDPAHQLQIIYHGST